MIYFLFALSLIATFAGGIAAFYLIDEQRMDYYFNKFFKTPFLFKPKFEMVTHQKNELYPERYSFNFRNFLGFKVKLQQCSKKEVVNGCYIFRYSPVFIYSKQNFLKFIEA